METKISVEYYMQGIVVDSSEHFEVCVYDEFKCSIARLVNDNFKQNLRS